MSTPEACFLNITDFMTVKVMSTDYHQSQAGATVQRKALSFEDFSPKQAPPLITVGP